MKISEIEQSGIHLGTHGEKYGNWMSAPVLYMVGGLLALAVVLAVLLFTVFRLTVLGVIFVIAAAIFLVLLGWIAWIRRQYSFDGGAMLELLTKPYEYHMIDFLCDAENYFGMTEQDFARWDDKVLLILSEDDTTFNQAYKDSLIAIMPHPTVVTNLTGGHLALMVRLEQYAGLVTEYIQKRI